MQGPIDAVLALRAAHQIDPAAVDRIEVGMLAAGFAIVCDPPEAKRRPTSVVDAQFSLPFGVAVALVRGVASPAEFAVETFADPAVQALLPRVEAQRDASLDAVFPRAWPCWVRIRLAGGRTLETRVDHPRGDPENFPSPAELDAKFRALAGRVLSPAALDCLGEAIAGFAGVRRAATLLAATVPTGT